MHRNGVKTSLRVKNQKSLDSDFRRNDGFVIIGIVGRVLNPRVSKFATLERVGNKLPTLH